MSTPFEPSKYAILVVDDEALNRDMLARRLERRGYFVMTAPGGEEALEAVRTAGCDLVILDLMMPELSGHDVLVELRKTRSFAELPIIMASARGDSEAITTAIDAGANDYVTKPLDFPVVLAKIRMQLALKDAVDQLKASEARFKLVADRSPDVITLLSPEGVFRFVSAASRSVLARSPTELVGTSIFELIHPLDRALVPDRLANLGEARTVRMSRADGTPIWVELHAAAIHGSRTGKVTDVQCTIRDISRYLAPPEPRVKNPSLPPTLEGKNMAPTSVPPRPRAPSMPPSAETVAPARRAHAPSMPPTPLEVAPVPARKPTLVPLSERGNSLPPSGEIGDTEPPVRRR